MGERRRNPELGETVLYVDANRLHAAIVINAFPEGVGGVTRTVTLVIFGESSLVFAQAPYSEEPVPGTWHFRPGA